MLGKVTRTLFSRLLLILIIILFTPMFLIMLITPKAWLMRSRAFFYLVQLFYRTFIKFSLLPITFVGKQHIPSEPAIFVVNHQSSYDIPLAGYLTNGHPHIWLAKEELMDSWLLRIVLPRVTVLVDPTSPRKAMRSLLEIIKLVNGSGAHLMIFPEGGRFIDGTVHEFYAGFVTLAKKTGRPVVPVRIFGVNEVYPPDQFWIHYCPVKVIVGEPMIIGETENDESFKKRVYTWFLAQTAE
jgi:1-acyl-sn-glycerol-3-phosphate acyltransferase